MTILIIPTEHCNFRCTYCFEPDSVRRPKQSLDLNYEAIAQSLQKLWNSPYCGSDIGIHGGECTTLQPRELEAVLKLSFDYSMQGMNVSRRGTTGVTTNGYNINESFIRLFKKYNTNIGISCDGPASLNTLRGPNPKNEKVTLGYNRRLWKIIKKLRREKIGVSMMCILHTENAGSEEKVDELVEWLLKLSDLNIVSGRLNPMFSAPWNKQYELTNDQLFYIWKQIFRLNTDYGLRWNPLREMQDNLLGFSLSPCVYNQCNVFESSTVSILPDGTISNCDRTFCYGLHVRAQNTRGSGRYSALPQEQCIECKYWAICNGGCPCEGVDGDWRNKTRFCEAQMEIYDYMGSQMKGMFPNLKLATDTDEREPFKLMSQRYSEKPSCYGAAPLRDQVLDSLAEAPLNRDHGDKPHGDRPHGDSEE